MRRKIYMSLFCFSILLLSCATPAWLKENRSLLKEYAFSRCLWEASKDSTLFNNDISLAVYTEIAQYSPEAYNTIASLAKTVAADIEPSMIADYENKKAILVGCFIFYKSKQLDSLVKSLDRQTFKAWQ